MPPIHRLLPWSTVALLFCTLVTSLQAATLSDARITEFLTSNSGGIQDADGDRSDWIEIWNSSGIAGDLGGWYLSDDPADLTKWPIPAVQLNSGAYIVVFASGKNRSDPAAELHTNFKLQSAGGGYLALVKPDGATLASEFSNYPQQTPDIAYGAGFQTALPVTLVETGDTAKWLIPSAPVAGWTDPGFDDSAWSSGATGLGYDNANGKYSPFFGVGDDLRTAMRTVNPSAYIRIAFDVPDPAGITDLVFSALWEDGFVVHLNGSEVHRERAPSNPVWNSTSDPASGRTETDAITFFDYPLTTGSLIAGTNVLAIHGLNDSAGSSDFLISPRLTGTQQDVVNLVDGFFPEPTPAAENSARFDGITADTKFSTDRGLHETPFDLAITTATPDATIRYTTDGTPPSETSGTIYTAPINVSATTVIRAIAYKLGFRSTNIDTHSYIFPADVLTQPKMRAAITQSAVYGPQMIDSLKAVPTISLVTEHTAFENEGAANIRTEHQTSIEMIFPDGTPGFQEDGGLSNYGGRFTNFPKKSFRVAFRSEFGTKKLKFPIFDGFDYQHFPPAEEFDVINLRSGSHDMQSRGAYMSNRFTDDSMLDMGNIAPHGRFVHLYLNGKYWGQYHLRERWSADMAQSYFGGPEADYDAVNANDNFINDLEVYDGTGLFWNEMRSLVAGPDPFNNAAGHIDIANIIDFMLLWVSGDSESEFRSFGSAAQGVPFKFMIKDADGYLRGTSAGKASHAGPLSVMSRMRSGPGGPDFSILLADRIHKHFFNDGALTPEKNIERLRKRVDEARLGFYSEAARWGDRFRDPPSWESYQTNLFNNHFPNLTQTMIDRFKSANMYPDIIAPVLSQHGGSIPPGGGITMSTGASAVYYTLDGSDPRQPGGAIRPTAIHAPFAGDVPEPQDFIASGDEWKYLDDGSDQGTAWRATAFDDNAWAAGPSALGYGESDQATTVGFIDTDPGTSGTQRNATTYFRRNVSITAPASFSYFSLTMKYDDGAAVYINGSEAVRTSNLPANAAFDTFSTGSTPNENTYFEFIIPTSSFVDGQNTFAVEIHNASSGSSDITFDLRLRGEIDTSNGDNVTEPVILSRAAQLNARAYNSATGEWSALTSTFFSINSTPATASNLAISEIHYHPAEPATPGEIAISTDRDDYEFIELLNIGAQSIDLTGVHFSSGINFAFPENSLLDPGARAVLVRDATAFTERYGAGVQIAGEYSGRLSNDGEQLTLSLTGVGDLRDFTYNDQLPWPTLPDGGGYSLVLRDPATNPDHALAENWGTHAVIGGAPGQPDTLQVGGYATWKTANNITDDNDDSGDEDNIPAIIEFALGTSLTTSSTSALPIPGVTSVGTDQFLTITYEKNPLANDILFQLQSSTDLANWKDETAIQVAPNTYRTDTPIPADGNQFLRLQISQL